MHIKLRSCGRCVSEVLQGRNTSLIPVCEVRDMNDSIYTSDDELQLQPEENIFHDAAKALLRRLLPTWADVESSVIQVRGIEAGETAPPACANAKCEAI